MNRLHVVVISMCDLITTINLCVLVFYGGDELCVITFTSRSGIHLESTNLWKTKHPFYFFHIKTPHFYRLPYNETENELIAPQRANGFIIIAFILYACAVGQKVASRCPEMLEYLEILIEFD